MGFTSSSINATFERIHVAADDQAQIIDTKSLHYRIARNGGGIPRRFHSLSDFNIASGVGEHPRWRDLGHQAIEQTPAKSMYIDFQVFRTTKVNNGTLHRALMASRCCRQ